MKKNISLILIFIISLFTLSGCQNDALSDGFSVGNSKAKRWTGLYLAYQIEKKKYNLDQDIEIIIYPGHNYYYGNEAISEKELEYYRTRKYILKIYEFNTNIQNITKIFLEYNIDDFCESKYDASTTTGMVKILKFNEAVVVSINFKSLENLQGNICIDLIAYQDDTNYVREWRIIKYSIKNDYVKFSK